MPARSGTQDVAAAEARLPLLEGVKATWLEEPFNGSAYEAYGALAKRPSPVKLAGGEAAHNIFMAKHTIDIGKVGFIQIDCGRIGGIGPAKQVADYAVGKGVTYVNHTFTSHLALCASIQPYAGLSEHKICEYPVKPQPMAWEMCKTHIAPDKNGEIRVPETPGLGIEPDLAGDEKVSGRCGDQGRRKDPVPDARFGVIRAEFGRSLDGSLSDSLESSGMLEHIPECWKMFAWDSGGHGVGTCRWTCSRARFALSAVPGRALAARSRLRWPPKAPASCCSNAIRTRCAR